MVRHPLSESCPCPDSRKTVSRGIKQLRTAGRPPLPPISTPPNCAPTACGQLIRASGHYPLSRRRRHQPLLPLRRARHAPGQTRRHRRSAHALRHLRRQDRRPFFKSISTSGRVGGLFDFENRRLGKIFFPDVDSRFKFCALIFGGEERRFPQTDCAFFLHDTAAVDDPDRCFPLAPADFARVNPNTGTAPVFRTRRDADITRRIYERHPVLVDHSGDEEVRAWPVRYQCKACST